MTRLFLTLLMAMLAASTTSFAVRSPAARALHSTRLHDAVPLANGSMSFDRVCREWRCKYTGDKATSASLEAIGALVAEYLPTIRSSTASSDVTVNRLVCGACLDFKLMMTVPLSDFGPWEAAGFAPEEEFLKKLTSIDGVSQVETQTITNMIL